MLHVNVDSYVTLEEADLLAKGSFLSTDKAFSVWVGLTDEDKEVLLRNSTIALNNLKYTGRRKKYGQALEFPRVDESYSGIGTRLFIGQFQDNGLISGNSGGGDGGLSLAKRAQVINAVYSALYNDLATDQLGITIQGLTSKKAGPISETYGRGSGSYDALNGIYTPKVFSLLTPWLSGGHFSI